MKESSNFLNNSMANLTEYYKQLCDDLKIQRMVLEQLLQEAKKKKKKKADKDYDGDGKVESGSEEYLGSRSNAIKKAVAKREGKELKENYLREANLGSEAGRRAYQEQRRREQQEFMNSLDPETRQRLQPPQASPDKKLPRETTRILPNFSGMIPTGSKLSKERASKIKPFTNNQTDGETDEDIIRMRQTAADQGGIPQDMVNEPIERTKQLPDGRTIYSKTTLPPKVRPEIGRGGPIIPKMPKEPSMYDAASDLLNAVTGRRPGKVRNPTGELVRKQRNIYFGEPGPRIPGDGSLEDRYPDIFRPKPVQRGLWDIGRTNPKTEARDELDMRIYYQNKYS